MFNKKNWNLILVNHFFCIPENFSVELENFSDGYLIDKRIIPYFSKMILSAKYCNCNFNVFSAYRSINKQISLVEESIKKNISSGLSLSHAREKTFSTLAVPGFSEHHTGLAIDIYSTITKDFDNINFENTKEYTWLINNSYKYGFILRYPKNKYNITNILFEPWHFRFVGINAAKYMYYNNLCLEEFYNKID